MADFLPIMPLADKQKVQTVRTPDECDNPHSRWRNTLKSERCATLMSTV